MLMLDSRTRGCEVPEIFRSGHSSERSATTPNRHVIAKMYDELNRLRLNR